MIEIKNVKVYGIEESIKRSGLPKLTCPLEEEDYENLTEKDLNRVRILGKVSTGTGHDNFLKGIIVQFDLTYPQYFTPQLQRYNWIDIVSSQSKMHTLTERKDIGDSCNREVELWIIEKINEMIRNYNSADDKEYWFRKIINNLPMGFLLDMGISTNYLQLKTIYFQRKNHKLTEWRYFCDWIVSLPYFKEIVLGIRE